MSKWIRGNASDYQDLSDVLVAIATGNSVASIDSVAAGGSGYVVGEIITLTGGTATVNAQVEVTAISGGAVTAARIYNSGSYTSDPSDPVAQGSSDGSGTGATFNLTLTANGWTVDRNTFRSLTTVDSIVSGGTGYSVDDIITLDGGVTPTGVTQAQLRVTAVSSGVITSVSIEDAGDYDVLPTDPVGQLMVVPSGGSGATFNLTFGSGEKEVIMHGSGGGSDSIYIGWRTFSGSGYYNLELHGFTGYDADLPCDEQPLVSPGFYDASLAVNQHGCYLTAINSTLSYWVNINSYRLVLEIKAGSGYFPAYLGFGNRFGTTSEYPYPMCIAGNTSKPTDPYSQTKLSSGLTDPWADSIYNGNGPMVVMNTDNNWYQVKNGDVSIGSRVAARDVCVTPAQTPAGTTDSGTPPEDKFCDGSSAAMLFSHLINQSSLGGTPDLYTESTPGTTNVHVLLPATIVMFTPSIQVLMELDEVYWCSGYNIVPEDRIIISGVVYRVFQNCNRTDTYSYLAIREAS